ncbi:MAG: NtaA/DmoA family FMN-dependent monooxygenase [Rhodobacteraceae bacterium]|nr:NtaA/DmoA family FMN-dependent monooxygenase [Paracoccaceae bacterium]
MKQIILGAFEINQVNLTSQGLWAHPEQTTFRYKDLSYWTELAKLLESGYFDFLFLADSYGYPDLNGEVPDATFEQAVELPKNDPMLLIPALSAVTKDLNFICTSSTSFEPPYANARRFATLDHLTKGRVAWNVVTTSSAVVSRLFGTKQVPHDARYDMAQEYLELSYKLFEGSWEKGAVIADKARRIYADPRKVHAIDHHGTHFTCQGYFNCEPSPQRTPVLVQAGASSKGRGFAAANAEVIFVQGKDRAMLRAQIDDLRQRAKDNGRGADAIKAISGLTVVTGLSRAHAEERLEEYLSWIDPEAMRAYYAMMTGVDLAKLAPKGSFSDVKTEGSQTQVERYKGVAVEEAVADFLRRGMRELIVTGTGKEAAEEIAEIVAETGLDGFNFTPFVSPGSYADLIRDVVPQLQRMGLMRRERHPSTFRERLFGRGQARLPDSHPAAQMRWTPGGSA